MRSVSEAELARSAGSSELGWFGGEFERFQKGFDFFGLCLNLKPFSPDFIAGFASVHQLIRVEVIFRKFGIFPSLHEVVGIEGIEAAVLAVVPQDIFRHGLDIRSAW